MSIDIIPKTVRHIVDLISTGRYDLVLQACSKSRLTEADLERVIQEYGRNMVLSPADADQYIDAVAVKDCSVPTWSVCAPVWTREEGRSDLTLELTIIVNSTGPEVELDGLHVL